MNMEIKDIVIIASIVAGLVGVIITALTQLIISKMTTESNLKQELSLVAIEKRLEVLQKAYSLVLDMTNYPGNRGLPEDERAIAIYGESLSFLKENAIYLAQYPKAYEAFEEAYNLVEQCDLAIKVKDFNKLTSLFKELGMKADIIKGTLKLPDMNNFSK
jgi:hypothetical protein